MDAVTYLKEKARLTNECTIACRNCEFDKAGDKEGNIGCNQFEGEHPEQAVALIEQWAKDRPKETYRTKFLKNYPKAYADCGGFPCINLIYGKGAGKCQGDPTCAKCWDAPYKEENE